LIALTGVRDQRPPEKGRVASSRLRVDLLTSDAHWPFCVASDEHRTM